MTFACLLLPLITAVVPTCPQYETYKLATEWLSDNVKEGFSVAAGDIGILRFYYKKGPVICMEGSSTRKA